MKLWKWNIVWLVLLASGLAMGGTSTRTITADIIRTVGGVRAFWTLPNGANDTFVGKATTDTFTNKSMDGGLNTFTNIPANTAFTGITPVNRGGTGLATLPANGVMVGEGTSVPNFLASLQFQPLVGNASGDPSFQALALNQSAAVTGTLPIANGGTANGALAVTTGGVIAADGSKLTNIGAGAAGQLLMGGTPPVWSNNTMTKTILTTTGSATGYWFTITAAAAGIQAGCVYTNNAQTFTVLSPVLTGSVTIWMRATGAPLASGTLTYSSGGGVLCNGGTGTNITFSANTALATYTPPATAKMLKVFVQAGGGAGGCGTTVAAQNSAGAGGPPGAMVLKYVTPAVSSYQYSVGIKGTGCVAVASNGTISSFVGNDLVGATFLMAGAGLHGSTCAPSILCTTVTPSTPNPASVGGDFTFAGVQPGPAVVLNGTTMASSGAGGSSFFGGGGSAVAGGQSAGVAAAATSYGAGGGGSLTFNGGVATTGGDGAPGVILIEEYY